MGRHFEVRAASMAATAAKKSAIYMRASKEIYMAAKRGTPDPSSNLALRSAIEKYRKSTPRDVIDRAIKKAAGGDAETFLEGRYEFFGPGNSYLIVDTLTDNVNRALTDVRTLVTRKGGHMGSVIYNFNMLGVLVFNFENKDTVEENLILGDVDVKEVSLEDGVIEVLVEPEALDKAKEIIKGLGVSEFEVAEVKLVPNEYIDLDDEHKERFQQLLDGLDEIGDVQAVYHNVNL